MRRVSLADIDNDNLEDETYRLRKLDGDFMDKYG